MSSAASATDKRHQSLLSATLVKSEFLSPETRLLTLQVQGGATLEFQAGQFIRVELEFHGGTIPLVYSIASPPGSGNDLELCVKLGRKGSPADHLCSLSVGSQLWITRPQGGFVMRHTEATTLFLAAGTGIAPIRSMVQSLLRAGHKYPVCLIFGAKDLASLFFHAEFAAFAERHPNFRYVPVLSRPHVGWNGASGYVQHHLDGVSRGTPRAYLCGPPEMVKSVSRLLSERGWPDNLVHYDRNGY